MKRGAFLSFALAASCALGAEDIFRPGEFFVGCNYWGSQAGVHMWRAQDWNPQEIEKDLAALKAAGVEVMRVFPTWSEFQPIAHNYRGSGSPGHFIMEGSETWVKGAGIDPEAMKRFRFFSDTAERNGIRLMVSLVTGWMSGRLFFPRALEDITCIEHTKGHLVVDAGLFVKTAKNVKLYEGCGDVVWSNCDVSGFKPEETPWKK